MGAIKKKKSLIILILYYIIELPFLALTVIYKNIILPLPIILRVPILFY